MKKISEHLGQIIVALACVAVLITTVTFFQAPISNFFAGVINKETSLGNTVVQGIDALDISNIGVNGDGASGGAGEFSLTTLMSLDQPGPNGAAGQMVEEDNYLYFCRYGNVYKIDISDMNSPEIVAQGEYSYDEESVKVATGMQINGDYIYVGSRRAAAGYPTTDEATNLKAGELAVLKKSDLSVVSITPLGKKVAGMSVHENLLVVNEQLLGWGIYDVSNPAEPVLLDEVDFERGYGETQGGEIFEVAGRVYYAAAGFGEGIRMYDITEFAEYIENPTAFAEAPEVSDDNLLWLYRFYTGAHYLGGNHTYDLTVKYPYVYATIAAGETDKANEDRIQGVLTLDISNIGTVPANHVLSMITNEDKNNILTASDPQPTVIRRIGNWLFLNNEDKGVACFEIGTNPAEPIYKGCYKPSEGCFVYELATTENGKLVVADSNDVADTPKIYIVEGWK